MAEKIEEKKAELSEFMDKIDELLKKPEVIEFVNTVKYAKKIEDALKAMFKLGQDIGTVHGKQFVSKPEYGFTPEVLIGELGERASEYIKTEMVVDKKKLEDDIKKGIISKEIQTKRIITGSKIYFEKVKAEVQESFSIS